MDADEIQPLSREVILQILESRRQDEPLRKGNSNKRRSERWPFPGAVELWVPVSGAGIKHVIAVCHNLSEGGVGIRCDTRLVEGVMLEIAVHQPEMTLHGKAYVRHCTARGSGYLAGLEFSFES